MIVAPGADWLTPDQDAREARVSYYANPQPRVPDYYLETLLANSAEGSSNFFAFLMLRRVDSGTYYGGGWYAAAVAPDCYIFRVVGGVYTQLAVGDCNFTGDGFRNSSIIRFSVQGDTLTLSNNGTPVLTAQGGNAIPGPGNAGVGAGNIRNPTDQVSRGLALDNLSIVEIR